MIIGGMKSYLGPAAGSSAKRMGLESATGENQQVIPRYIQCVCMCVCVCGGGGGGVTSYPVLLMDSPPERGKEKEPGTH